MFYRQILREAIIRWGSAAAIIIVMALASIVPIRTTNQQLYAPDDAYITLVYARSLADGDGFRTHPNAEPSLGTTTPFFAITLALLSPLTNLPDLAITLSLTFWILTGWLWAWRGNVLGLSKVASLSIGVMVLIETKPWLLHLGMEPALFCFLLTATVMLYFAGHPIWTGVTAGLLFLTRGEGILIIPALLAYEGMIVQPGDDHRELGRRLSKTLLGSAIVIGLWSLYALLAVGRILPHTLRAKSVQVELGFIQSFVDYTAQIFTRDWSNLGMISLATGQQTPTVISVWLLLALIGLAYAWVFHRQLLVLAFWGIGFFVGYALLNAPGYTWYPLSLLYVTVVFAGLTLALVYEVVVKLATQFDSPASEGVGLALNVLVMIVMAMSIVPANIPDQSIDSPTAHDYRRLGEWFQANTAPDTTVPIWKWVFWRGIVSVRLLICWV
jgi:hypothetical protein